MATGSETEQGARAFGPYRLEALIGRGGMAEVFRARCVSGPRAGQAVAIKRLKTEFAKDDEAVEHFIGEADLSRMLHHPNIIQVYEAGTVGDQYFMAMELIDGRDLGQIVRRCRERKILLPIDFSVYLGVMLLQALGYAHQAMAPSGRPLGIVHRDVSPANLFISRTGEIKLGDFGIAKAMSVDRDDEDRGVWGKVYYLSPEALDGEVGIGSDLWAACVTLYELLTNERPFVGANPDQVSSVVRKASPMPVRVRRPEVSEGLERAVMRGFAKNSRNRHVDAAAFAAALRPHYNELIGTPLAIAAVVRGLFGA